MADELHHAEEPAGGGTIPPEAAEAALAEKNCFGRYILIEKIGQGGMGLVSRAWDRSVGRFCAVKTLLPNVDPDNDVSFAEQCDRFLREARTAAGLSHPNIVQVYDVGAIGTTHYIAMEFVPGETLRAYLNRSAAETRQETTTSRIRRDRFTGTLWIFHDVVRAVGFAHRNGIIHRDIKPENIFLTRVGDRTVPKIGDFGLAKEIGSSLRITASGTALGTPRYMSPEQVEGKGNLDARSDVFSLGCALYEVVTGTFPFDGEGAVAVMRAVTEREPVSPRKRNPAIDRDLETIILKALEKEPQRRYADGDTFAEDLKRLLMGETIAARPATFGYRLTKAVRRHRTASALVGSALLLIAVVGLYALVSREAQEEAIKGLESEKGRVEAEKTRAETSKSLQDVAQKAASQGWMIASEVGPEFYKNNADMDRVWKMLATAMTHLDRSIALQPTAPAHFYRGRVHLLRLNYDEAEKEFDAAIALDKDFAEASVFRGVVAMAKFAERYVDPRHQKVFGRSVTGEYLAKAAEDLRRISASAIKEEYQPFQYLISAFLLLDENNPQPCREKLDEGFRLFRREEFLYWAAVVEYMRNRSEEVRTLLKRALEIRPQYPEAIVILACLESDDDRQIAMYTKAIAVNPSFAAAYLNRGDVYKEKGIGTAREDVFKAKNDYAAALADFDRVVELRPRWTVAHEHRAVLRGRMGDWDDAREDYDNAIRLSPNWSELYVQRGEVKRYQGIWMRMSGRDPAKEKSFYDDAERDFETASTLDPGNADAWKYWGIMRSHRWDRKGAIEKYTKAIEIKPSSELFRMRAGARESLKDLLGAIEDYTSAIAIETSSDDLAYAYRDRGIARLQLREYGKAVEDYTRSLMFQPLDATTWHRRGIAKFYKKDLEAAAADFAWSIMLNPRESCVYYFLARTKLILGDPDGAIVDFTLALAYAATSREDLDVASAHAFLGDAYEKKGDDVAALREWRKALGLNPSFEKQIAPRVKRAEERLRRKGN